MCTKFHNALEFVLQTAVKILILFDYFRGWSNAFWNVTSCLNVATRQLCLIWAAIMTFSFLKKNYYFLIDKVTHLDVVI